MAGGDERCAGEKNTGNRCRQRNIAFLCRSNYSRRGIVLLSPLQWKLSTGQKNPGRKRRVGKTGTKEAGEEGAREGAVRRLPARKRKRRTTFPPPTEYSKQRIVSRTLRLPFLVSLFSACLSIFRWPSFVPEGTSFSALSRNYSSPVFRRDIPKGFSADIKFPERRANSPRAFRFARERVFQGYPPPWRFPR